MCCVGACAAMNFLRPFIGLKQIFMKLLKLIKMTQLIANDYTSIWLAFMKSEPSAPSISDNFTRLKSTSKK